MSRVQLALNVNDIDEAVAFYATLFGTQPAKRRPGYANFAIAEPPLKLVLLENPGQGGSLNHLGVEVADAAAVDAEHARLTGEGLAPEDERGTTCCYARQDKFWVQGSPGGEKWEVYTVLEDSPTSGARMTGRPRTAAAPGRRPAGRRPVPAAPDRAGTAAEPAATGLDVTEVAATQMALWRRLLAELLGSGFLAAVVVGSGIAAQRLSPAQTGLESLENAAATTLGLILVIFALARSGRSRAAPAAVGAYIGAAYFFTSSTSFANPAITIGRMFSDTFAGIAPPSVPGFIAAQIIGPGWPL